MSTTSGGLKAKYKHLASLHLELAHVKIGAGWHWLHQRDSPTLSLLVHNLHVLSLIFSLQRATS